MSGHVVGSRVASASGGNGGRHRGSESMGPRPGCPVQAWRYDVLHYRGVVEETLLSSGVLWIREDGLGHRKMIDLQEYHLRLG
ncbi:UNVERIFIED_CONTAM: hypothetical protein RF653_06725 [Kocuria sp. CPCC 205316]|uniref:hypothetical protein n=1 Tax=Kocuria TaxID=57493 RepID=UPI0036DE06EE